MKYHVLQHACKRYIERIDKNVSEHRAKKEIERQVSEGVLVLEYDDARYIRFKDALYPCSPWLGDHWLVKTTLRWDMKKEWIAEILDILENM